LYKLQRALLTLLLVTLVYSLHPHALTADDASSLTKDQIKQFLLTAKIVSSHGSKKGITNTQRLTLSAGTLTHDASFQAVDEHEALKKFADGRTEVLPMDLRCCSAI
jgi:hypothetical protein